MELLRLSWQLHGVKRRPQASSSLVQWLCRRRSIRTRIQHAPMRLTPHVTVPKVILAALFIALPVGHGLLVCEDYLWENCARTPNQAGRASFSLPTRGAKQVHEMQTRSSILILNHTGLTRPGHSPTPLQEWLLRCDSVVLASYVGLGLRAQFVLRA